MGAGFLVIGGLPENIDENYAYEYDAEFRFVQRHVIASGHTHLGIQTACRTDDGWLFGCYGKRLLRVDDSFRLLGNHEFDARHRHRAPRRRRVPDSPPPRGTEVARPSADLPGRRDQGHGPSHALDRQAASPVCGRGAMCRGRLPR